ncbi:PCI-domain-containing protein [Ascodesmis nigricans]|uniref:PCI-domain-containing protein n=1 Tax=Ascodesmis nigricans TaxID=341454 RepID=A0A4S2N8F3_9PEZI|nr:PCI-domain-containing protein [Ascodesmis nigricans]
MATSTTAQAHWTITEAGGQFVVHGIPRFDLEGYIGNYSGRTRIDRLLFIGHHSVAFAPEALKLAIKALKETVDVRRYQIAVEQLQRLAPDDPDAVLDEEWMEITTRKTAKESEKIEQALKSYKGNLIKESIRMGHEDQGNHFYACGDLIGAHKAYGKMRDFCTAPKHIVDMSLALIKVSIEQNNFPAVNSHVAKIRTLTRTAEEEEQMKPRLCAAMGLFHLANGAYRESARSFLETPASLGATYNDVISSNDVAVYGALCSLASMSRKELKSEVLDNSEFRNFLELEPHMRKAISYFYSAKYSECLKILEEWKNDYLLDIHLHKHIDALYERVRTKAIVQYFIPFSCVTLKGMAEAFNTPEEKLAKELVGLIENGKLMARVDTKNGLLVAKSTDPRSQVHRDALLIARTYEKQARMKLVRMNMISAGLEVKQAKTSNTGRGSSAPEGPESEFVGVSHQAFLGMKNRFPSGNASSFGGWGKQ